MAAATADVTAAGSSLLRAYMEHERDLLRFLKSRLGSASLAADVAHDVYLKLRCIENVPPVRDSRAYLFSIAGNLATDYLRVEKRRHEIRAEAQGTIWDDRDELTPERHAMARAEVAYLEAEIAKLPARCKQVFYLNRYETCRMPRSRQRSASA